MPHSKIATHCQQCQRPCVFNPTSATAVLTTDPHKTADFLFFSYLIRSFLGNVVNVPWWHTVEIFGNLLSIASDIWHTTFLLDVQAKLFVPFQWKNLNDKYVNTRKSLFMKLICHPDSNFVVFNKLPITLLLSCLLSFKWAICIYYFNLEMVTKIYNSSW